MIVLDGNIYLEKEHIKLLKTEPEYVKKRYFAIARALVPAPFKIGYKKATRLIGVCLRHFYRIVKRFREEEISGLRLKSTRPKKSPNQTPKREEYQITAVRKRTDGPNVAAPVNESNQREGKEKRGGINCL